MDFLCAKIVPKETVLFATVSYATNYKGGSYAENNEIDECNIKMPGDI